MGLTIGVLMIAVVVSTANDANAQLHGRRSANRTPVYSGMDADGMTMSTYEKRINPLRSLKMASHGNPYTPESRYTYSNAGVLAQRTHTWNQDEAAGRPWHGDYQNWRWREPTALVVPPTASYQSSYAWGVGQVRSTPIHHQFGRRGAGMIGGGGEGFSTTPYWPSSTDQFGIYPVRAPW